MKYIFITKLTKVNGYYQTYLTIRDARDAVEANKVACIIDNDWCDDLGNHDEATTTWYRYEEYEDIRIDGGRA